MHSSIGPTAEVTDRLSRLRVAALRGTGSRADVAKEVLELSSQEPRGKYSRLIVRERFVPLLCRLAQRSNSSGSSNSSRIVRCDLSGINARPRAGGALARTLRRIRGRAAPLLLLLLLLLVCVVSLLPAAAQCEAPHQI